MWSTLKSKRVSVKRDYDSFCYFSCNIKGIKKDDEIKKEVLFPKGWINMEKEYDKSKNGLCIITGKKSNVTVIDYDNKESFEEDVKLYPEIGNYVVRTRKGYHCYFLYNDKIPSGSHGDYDYQNDKRCVICPPTKYKCEKTIFKYELITNGELKEMSDDYNDYCLNRIGNTRIKKNVDKKEDKKSDNKQDDNRLSSSDYKLVLDLLNLLPSKYKEKYDKWLSIGIILFNICNRDGLNLWKDFSKSHKSYDEKVCEDKYGSFKGGEMGMGTLIYYIKKGINKNKLKEFLNKNIGFLDKYKDTPEDIIYKCIENELKDLCENQKFDINNISKNDKNQIVATLNDKYCSSCNVEHKGGCNSVVIGNDTAQFCCTELGWGKAVPTQYNYLKQVNNYYTTNYINGGVDDILVTNKYQMVFKDDELNKLVHDNVNTNANKTAQIIRYLNPEKIKNSNKKWYVYDNHHWEELEDDLIPLRKMILDLYRYNNDMVQVYKDETSIMRNLQKLERDLGDTSFQNNVINQCMVYYKDKEFYEKLESKSNLLCFNNGVFDLNEMKFRDGKLDDYVTIQIKYEYTQEKSDKYNDILEFFKNIMPKKDNREFLQKFLGSSLLGRNSEQIFVIFTGSGANGKSILNELLELTLGSNYVPTDSTTLTSTNEKGSPSPELLDLRNARIMSCQEPSDKRKFNTETIKKITGGDIMVTRALYNGNMEKFVCKAQLIISCNDIPDLDKLDGGIRRRLRVLEFPTKFVKTPKRSNEKKRDNKLNEKIKDWKNDMFIWLLEGLELYRKEGLEMTEDMLNETNLYQNEQDIFYEYANSNLEVCDKCNECKKCLNNEDCLDNRISLSELWKNFRSWHNSNNNIKESKFNKEIKEMFKDNFRKKMWVNGKNIYGFVLLKYKDN